MTKLIIIDINKILLFKKNYVNFVNYLNFVNK